MIYEVRTYDLKPHSVPEFEQRFGEAYVKRRKYSELAAFWHTEIGPLNQVIHVWPYADVAEREKVRAAAVRDGVWPPKASEFVMAQRVDIMEPFPFSPPLKPGKMGPFFEIRSYTPAPGDMPKLAQAWVKALPRRLEFGPLCAVWHCELGGVNRFVHIWPYPSLDARADIRGRAQAAGAWPPSAQKLGTPPYHLLNMENKIVMPAAFSPLQ